MCVLMAPVGSYVLKHTAPSLQQKNVYFKNQKLIIIKMNKASNKQALSLLVRGVDVPPSLPVHLCEVPCYCHAPTCGPRPLRTTDASMACADDTDSIYQCPDTESLNHVPPSFVGKISQGDFCTSLSSGTGLCFMCELVLLVGVRTFRKVFVLSERRMME